MKNERLTSALRPLSRISKPNISISLLICLITNSAISQITIEDTTTFALPKGFIRTKIISNFQNSKNELVATLFKMENLPSCKIKFVSRKKFQGNFTFENIKEQCKLRNEQMVLQVAAAFTPDWKVIEGFALENGQIVGQDRYFGQNRKISYKGMLLIEDGKPLITHSDKILHMDTFIGRALQDKCSLFQQFAAIIDGKINTRVNLPGIYKRRFFVEIIEDNTSKYGIVSFLKKMHFSDAVKVLKEMESDNLTVYNALYLDMGAVSEGYFYDDTGKKHLLGDCNKNIMNYTNMLVAYKDLGLDHRKVPKTQTQQD